jgi:hypothetical protein
MKFILLVHHDEAAFEKMSDETKRGLLAESIRLCQQLDAKGEYVHASPVHPAATATLVRVRGGRRSHGDRRALSSKRGSRWRVIF